jgi:uncharacterized repeat protein (TIGR03803 family)
MVPLSGVSRPPILVAVAVAIVFIFPVAVKAQTVTLIHRFPNYGTITYPVGPPVQGRDGRLYGYTYLTQWGSTFRENLDGTGSPLYVFSSSDGGGSAVPFSPLLLASDGNWYGATGDAYENAGGTLFKITPSGDFTILHSFATIDGGASIGSPIEVNGLLYGTTVGGRNVGPAVYTSTLSGTFTLLYQFNTTQFTSSAGALVQGSDGYLYGAGTGSDGCGAAFKMTTDGVLMNIVNFSCSLNIGAVNSPLLEDKDGNFYGTSVGSWSRIGAVFKLSKNGAATNLHAFGSGPTDGLYANHGLIQGTDGNFYGTAWAGGDSDGGTIYQVSTTGAYQQLYSFVYSYGRVPSGLMQDTNGKFYGFLEFTGSYIASGEFYSLDMGLGPFVTLSLPRGGPPATTARILGQGLTGTTSVIFNGVAATTFVVVSDTYLTAVVPSGATTGPVQVTTPTGTLTGNTSFTVK